MKLQDTIQLKLISSLYMKYDLAVKKKKNWKSHLIYTSYKGNKHLKTKFKQDREIPW